MAIRLASADGRNLSALFSFEQQKWSGSWQATPPRQSSRAGESSVPAAFACAFVQITLREILHSIAVRISYDRGQIISDRGPLADCWCRVLAGAVQKWALRADGAKQNSGPAVCNSRP